MVAVDLLSQPFELLFSTYDLCYQNGVWTTLEEKGRREVLNFFVLYKDFTSYFLIEVRDRVWMVERISYYHPSL